MVKTFNLIEYGKELEKIRLSMNSTRAFVAKHALISKDTLYKLEKGQSIPKYDTLELLGNFYKTDLLKLLLEYRASDDLHRFNQDLEMLIVQYNTERLKELRSSFEEVKAIINAEDEVLNRSTLLQYELLIKGIEESYSDNREPCLDTFIEAMKLSNSTFTLETWNEYMYDFLEVRNLFLIAQGLFINKEHELSTRLLIFCLNTLSADERSPYNEKLLAIKCYLTISYNAHMLDQHELAFEYAKLGQEFSMSQHLSYALHNILYRRGIAEFNLGRPEYLKSLYSSVCLLDILGNTTLKQRYIDVTKKMYDIDILSYPNNRID